MRPSSLTDKIHDFGATGDLSTTFIINGGSFLSVYNLATDRNFAIQHFLTGGSNVSPTLQNQSGQSVPPGTTPTVYAKYENPTDYPVTIKNITSANSSSINFNSIATIPGKYKSDFYFLIDLTNQIFGPGSWIKYGSPNNPSNITSPNLTESYSYLVLQKSVVIIEDITTVPTVGNNQTKQVTTNSLVRVSKTNSRGKEVNSNWVIQVRDSNGNYISAIQGSDYNITFGSLGSDVLEIKVLQPKLFRIICNINGYTSSNNPFGTGTGSITTNSDSSFYQLNVEDVVTNFQDIITLPKINSSVTIQNQISNLPIQQGYTGSFIAVTSNVDSSTGLYIIKDITNNTQTVVTLNDSQWLQELTTRTNITLEIRNKITNIIVLTKDGMGPHTDIILPEGTYSIQFKTILK